MKPLRLGVNIDHVATIRNARGGPHPDPVRAARLAAQAGADGITAHLREDRRHISDDDIARLIGAIDLPLNLEMAATPEMLEIALRHRPHAACIVPERRQEVTTEGGLDVAGQQETLRPFVEALAGAGIRVSLFVDPDPAQLEAAAAIGAPVVELHTGAYCLAEAGDEELRRLVEAAARAEALGLRPVAVTDRAVPGCPVARMRRDGETWVFDLDNAIVPSADRAQPVVRRRRKRAKATASG